MSEEKRRILRLLQRLYAAIKSTNKNVSSIKEDNMVLLWENSAPGSAFAAQTIDMDLSDYKWVKIEVVPHAGRTTQVTTNEFQCPGAGDVFAPTTRTDMGGNGWWHGSRTVSITTTGITFGSGGYRYSNATSVGSGDSYAIPLRIWGIKKSYSVSLVKDVLPAENGGTGVSSLEELKSKLGVISGGGNSGSGSSGGATVDPNKVVTLKDYVVDEYNTGDWNVIKYASGKADLYYRKDNMSFTKVTSYGYSYMTEILELPLPLNLAQIDYANGSVGGSFTYAVDVTNMATNAIKYRFVSYAHDWTTQSGITIMFHVHGLWKALESTPTEVAAVKENTARLSIDMDGYEKSELVWTNPDPTAIFNPQTLTFDGVYDKLEIIFNYDKTYPDRVGTQKVIVNDSDESILNATWGGNVTRRVIATSANGKTTLEIQKGVRYISTEGESNAVCIPYKIYGIKTTSKLEGAVTGDNITLDIGVNKAADLNPDTLIPSGANLNDYTEPGSYLSPNKANSQSLVNCPFANGGFDLQVMKTSSGGIRQILIANSSKCLIYTRHWDTNVSDWVQMSTTVIKKVWENASIGSDFAGQTLSISCTASYILILTNRGETIIVPKDAGKIVHYGNEAYPTQRSFTYTSNSLVVSVGEYLNSGWKTGNGYMKPWRIFALEGVL